MKTVFLLCVLSITFFSTSAIAIQASTDQYVMGVYRFIDDGGEGADKWYTDLNVFNPNESNASVEIIYIQKSGSDSANSKLAGFTSVYGLGEELDATTRTNVASANVILEAGESQELRDIMKNLFGRDSAEGAFQIVSDIGVVAYGVLRNEPTTWGATLAIQTMNGTPKSSALTSSRIVGIKYLFLEYQSILFLVNPGDETTNVVISAKYGYGDESDYGFVVIENIVLSPGEVKHTFFSAFLGDSIQILFSSESPIIAAADVMNFSDDLYMLEMITSPKCFLQKFNGEVYSK